MNDPELMVLFGVVGLVLSGVVARERKHRVVALVCAVPSLALIAIGAGAM